MKNEAVTSKTGKRQADVLNINVSTAELSRLLSRSPSSLAYWAEHRGLPRNADGSYNVKRAILWLELYMRSKRPAVKVDALDQQHLSTFLGKSRQWIISRTKWDRLPRRSDGLYNLRAVCAWLPGYYRRVSERKYQDRLSAMRKRARRNVAQLERFLSGVNSKSKKKKQLILKGKKMDEQESRELTQQIKQQEVKNKELKIELFVRENPGLSDKELKEYFARTPEAREIFSGDFAFVAWVRHLPKVT